jgi:LacI family transcriptional regulator
MPLRKERQVALLIETSNRYCRELLYGIRAYMAEAGNWRIQLTEHGRGDRPPRWLRSWQGDGLIARIENRQIEKAIQEKAIPTVNVSASGLAQSVPAVISDSQAVAQLAIDHLYDRGFRNFAYCGDARFAWATEHGRHFAAAAKKLGFTCHTFETRKSDSTNVLTEQKKIAAWLKSLPKPVGVMACYDIRGQQLLDVCRQLELRVPDEVGVVGQHDDHLLCELCDPPLSSVIPNPQSAGYQAAALLDQMMSGKRVGAKLRPVKPMGVTTRSSTDLVAVNDPNIAEAVRFIQANALSDINVSDVLKASFLSRTLLERGFRTHLQRSPYEMIQQIRFQRAEMLLRESSLTIAEVSERSGFLTPEYFSATFKKRYGVSPKIYRDDLRASYKKRPQ